ncbi:hypothetical protein DRQ09_01940, partial [candidate division KSB1 bacterium]
KKEFRGFIFFLNLQPEIKNPQILGKYGKVVRWFLNKGNLLQGFGILGEVVNFADGKRNLLSIRDEVTAEYEPIPVWIVKDIFEILESINYVELKKVM